MFTEWVVVGGRLLRHGGPRDCRPTCFIHHLVLWPAASSPLLLHSCERGKVIRITGHRTA